MMVRGKEDFVLFVSMSVHWVEIFSFSWRALNGVFTWFLSYENDPFLFSKKWERRNKKFLISGEFWCFLCFTTRFSFLLLWWRFPWILFLCFFSIPFISRKILNTPFSYSGADVYHQHHHRDEHYHHSPHASDFGIPSSTLVSSKMLSITIFWGRKN